ncbi:hypothetical protein EN866_32960 [Mesorhizobium sp. M2D.F.Ca.ET.223.01.1.1]|uniref:hypothetical protein n=1 Tax=Mesorhizobium sp. M2D.F.Ca.ET.223.01.1.1 TaxID=2563940 RepID=UPI001092782A|nr:hypothetical protein [Mesorhizobium sp. M2D.F.Ca.ET.223.01.1.1]TGR84619.1 hypothetical protein EN866_32960 [Mesorhizobium sp. M2D.F.Ca.ET.223.01.1.1]
MPKGVYQRQPAEAFTNNLNGQSAVLTAGYMAPVEGKGDEVSVAPVKMVAMKLDRHYRPAGDYEVVGYLKKEVVKKFPDGQTKVIEPEEFIAGQMAPPPFPGVINENKVWASTTIRVPEAEAKIMRLNKIAERAFDD